jgi:hypothetical protein
MNTRLLGTALVFTFGSAIGCAAARYVVPPANAQQAATLTKWEYTCFEGSEASEFEPKAKAAGAEGWELAGVASSSQRIALWCFKRAKM